MQRKRMMVVFGNDFSGKKEGRAHVETVVANFR
jgi:hypothetical protein